MYLLTRYVSDMVAIRVGVRTGRETTQGFAGQTKSEPGMRVLSQCVGLGGCFGFPESLRSTPEHSQPELCSIVGILIQRRSIALCIQSKSIPTD
jgi:hypothetical protein